MSKRSGEAVSGNSTAGAQPEEACETPRSKEIVGAGIKTSEEYIKLSLALGQDLLEGTVSPEVANALASQYRNALYMLKTQLKAGKILQIITA